MARSFTFATVTAVTAVTALIVSLSPALAEGNSLFGGGPRYDGSIKIKDVTGTQCPPTVKAQLVGLSSDAVYRAKVKPTQIAEAMSVELPLAGAAIIVAGGDGYFRGDNKPLSGNFIMDAWPSKLPKDTVANLKFRPATIVEGTESFSFKGDITNFAFKDCKVTVSGTFNLRTLP